MSFRELRFGNQLLLMIHSAPLGRFCEVSRPWRSPLHRSHADR
ncbi:Uncharacterised protein [Vibrio cholerae]|nr:Uncharacterised protein [Vibrio cholerae]